MTVRSDLVRGMRLPLFPREIPEGERISKGSRIAPPTDETKCPG
jgi:hypothetical protein